jgi:hypothetical protein
MHALAKHSYALKAPLLLALGWLALLSSAQGEDQSFYTQTNEVKGIQIKAPAVVDPRALKAASAIVSVMLQDDGIISRMRARKAALAIIPRNVFMTALPEFAYLHGKKDSNNNPYDAFAVRGGGGIRSQPVTAVAEENLLRLKGDPWAAENTTYHEFGHGIMNLGFSEEQLRRWRDIYKSARQRNLFPGAFAMKNADEYWAELTQSFFGVNNEINGATFIRQRDPAAYEFLESVYRPKKP